MAKRLGREMKRPGRTGIRDDAIYRHHVNEIGDLFKLARKNSGEVVTQIINDIEKQARDLRFTLVDQFSPDTILKDVVANNETDPLACSDIYMRGIIRDVAELGSVLHLRAQDIRKIRQQVKKELQAEKLRS